MVRMHSVYMRPVRNWNGTVHIGSRKWTHKWLQIADSIRTGSTRSCVNTRLIRTNFIPVPNGSGPCKCCLNLEYDGWARSPFLNDK